MKKGRNCSPGAISPNCSPGAISPLFHNIFILILDFCVKTRTRFSLPDNRLFEITEVEITRVDCISNELNFSDVYQSVNYIGSLAKFT